MVSAMVGQKVVADIGHDATGPAGAMVGMALSLVSRKLGPLGMIGVAVGLWAMHQAKRVRAAPAEAQQGPARQL
jgi:hypothetical protein